MSLQTACARPHDVSCLQTLFIAQTAPTHVLYLSLARLPSPLSSYLAESPWLSHLSSRASRILSDKASPHPPPTHCTESHGRTWRGSLQSSGSLVLVSVMHGFHPRSNRGCARLLGHGVPALGPCHPGPCGRQALLPEDTCSSPL